MNLAYYFYGGLGNTSMARLTVCQQDFIDDLGKQSEKSERCQSHARVSGEPSHGLGFVFPILRTSFRRSAEAPHGSLLPHKVPVACDPPAQLSICSQAAAPPSLCHGLLRGPHNIPVVKTSWRVSRVNPLGRLASIKLAGEGI
jgi:hypothetical protein